MRYGLFYFLPLSELFLNYNLSALPICDTGATSAMCSSAAGGGLMIIDRMTWSACRNGILRRHLARIRLRFQRYVLICRAKKCGILKASISPETRRIVVCNGILRAYALLDMDLAHYRGTR